MKRTLITTAALCAIIQMNAQTADTTTVSTEWADTLQDLEVVAQKPIVKMKADQITYSVAEDPESKSLSVLDMLRKVPMVTVDGQDNITVNGSSSFKVYVDGKPNAMLTSNASQIFKAMPAVAVKSIEVVTNTGAKYDAEGAGGILNIKMANTPGGGSSSQSIDGYNGSLTAIGGNHGVGVSGYIAGQQKKFSYNANLGYRYIDNGKVEVDMTRKQDDGSSMDYSQTSTSRLPIITGDLSLGYQLDSLSSINASVGLMKIENTNTGEPTTHLYGGVYGTGFSYTKSTKSKSNDTSFNGSLDYQRFFNEDHSSSLTLTYQLNTNPGKQDSWDTYKDTNIGTNIISLVDNCSIGRTNTIENIAQLDLVTKLSNVSTLSSGLKYANRKSTSDMDYYIEDVYQEAMSTDYTNTDQIGALYAELANTWEKWSAKVGLRYEHTWKSVDYNQVNASDFKKNYGNLVPSASFSHTLKPGTSIGLNYNMRISRPGITYLNPYVDRTDPTSLSYGNINLAVEKSHNISFVFNYYTPKLMMNATLKERIANGGIEQYSFYDANILNTTYGNIVDRRSTSLSVFASWLIVKNTRFMVNAQGSYDYFNSDELNRINKGFSGNGYFSLQQTLPHNWNVSLSAILSTDSYTLQGKSSGWNIGIISVNKSFFKDKLSVSLNGLTGLSKGGKIHIDSTTEGKNFSNSMKIGVPLTQFNLNVVWKFGNTAQQFQKHQSKVESDYIEHKSDSDNIGSAGQM